MNHRPLSLAAALVVGALLLPATALSQEPDPDEFTPVGYEFCGWRDFEFGGWEMEWEDRLSGAYLVLFARNMTCRSARRNYVRTRTTQTPPHRLVRKGYRCTTLDSDYEYSDVRCSKRGRPRLAFRFQTGA